MVRTLAVALLLSGNAYAQEPSKGVSNPTLVCKFVKVVDGDTAEVYCPQLQPFQKYRLRIAGIDTPESRRGIGGAKCLKELRLGISVKAWLKTKFQGAENVSWTLRLDRGDGGRDPSMGGRVIADVQLPDGRDWAKTIISTDQGEYYDPDVTKSFQKPDYCK